MLALARQRLERRVTESSGPESLFSPQLFGRLVGAFFFELDVYRKAHLHARGCLGRELQNV